MEDKIKSKLIADLHDNKELKNTINFEGTEDYNVNAVTADVARHTMADLKLEPSVGGSTGLTDEYKGNFDGNTDKAIKYVPSDGGVFTGSVQINKNKYSVADVSLDDVINRGQMETVISQLDGAPLYTWDTSTGYNAVKNDKEEDYKLNTVIGSVEDLPVFEAYSEGKAHNKYVTPDSYDKAYITYGTYKDAYFNQAYDDIKGSITKLVFPNTYIDKDTGENKSVEKIRVNEFTANISQNYGFTNLATVYINPGITEIGNNAFSGCAKLTSAAIPNSITRIGLNTFSGCTGLTNVVLGSNISTIDAGAFSNCTGLTSIAICNNSVKIVKAKKVSSTNYSDAFSGCSALTKIYFNGSSEEWNTLVNEAGLDTNNPLRSATIISISDTAFPFLYICKGPKGEDTSLTSNKLFLKLPDEDLVEISKGAARLERRDSKTTGNVDYFTYDVLAAVIAGINSRITALGSQALALPEQLKIYDSETTAVVNIPTKIANESISTDSDKALLVEETVVPSVQELKQAIDTIGSEDGIERGEDGKFRLNEEFYKYLLKQTFKTPSISSFSLTGTNVSDSHEVGTTVTVTGIKHQETNTGNITENLTLSRSSGAGVSSNIVSTFIAKSSSSADVTVSDSFTASSSGTVTYTLSAPYKDTTGAAKTATKTASVSFYWPVYYGATSSAIPSDQAGLTNKGSSFGSSMLEIATNATNKHIHFLSTDAIKLYNSTKLPITPGATGTVSITVNGKAATYNYATIQNCGVGTQKIYVNI